MPYIDVEGQIPTTIQDAFVVYQIYNCLDSAVTAQVLPEILARMNDNHLSTYRREMNVCALTLELSTKGLPVDQMVLAELLYALEKDEARALWVLHQFCEAVGFRPINPRSTKDVPDLLYNHLGLPPIYNYDKKTKERKLTTDDKALEKLRTNYPIAEPFINAILAGRETRKMGSVFKRGLEPDGRLRCSYNPAGTETGRLSSSQNPYGRGTNAQNLTDRIRQVVTAPEGYAIVNLDLKTAESIATGFVSGCKAYIDACFSGDVHTAASRLNWRNLPWTGNLKEDKSIAERPYYRHFSFRDMAKKGGHLTNYFGQPPMMASHLRLPRHICEEFQTLYFEAFPEIKDWHLRTIASLQQSGIITTRYGRERRFWGRPTDGETWRKGIAFEPQSLVGEVMNEGLIRCQRWSMKECPEIDLLAQVHDCGVWLVPIPMIDAVIPELQKLLLVPVDFGELGDMIIPSDATIGRHWNKKPKTPKGGYMDNGLTDWKPGIRLPWM